MNARVDCKGKTKIEKLNMILNKRLLKIAKMFKSDMTFCIPFNERSH